MRDRPDTEELQRQAAWGRPQAPRRGSKRSLRADWVRDRQRVRRLKTRLKPTEPASSEDPWQIADTALRELSHIRHVRMRAEQHARLNVIAEALRRLAWGRRINCRTS